MKDAIINILNSIAERIKPHKHKWELLDISIWENKFNSEYKWKQWTYRCSECGEVKKIDNKTI